MSPTHLLLQLKKNLYILNDKTMDKRTMFTQFLFIYYRLLTKLTDYFTYIDEMWFVILLSIYPLCRKLRVLLTFTLHNKLGKMFISLISSSIYIRDSGCLPFFTVTVNWGSRYGCIPLLIRFYISFLSVSYRMR